MDGVDWLIHEERMHKYELGTVLILSRELIFRESG